MKDTSANPGQKIFLGIDIGGTTAKLGLFRSCDSPDGSISRPELIDRLSIPTRTENQGRLIVPDVAEAAETLAANSGFSLSDVHGAGVGVPGPVLKKTDDGFPIVGCVNLGFIEVRYLDAELRELTGIDNIFVCNDANAAALGELYFGGTPQLGSVSSAVMVTLGTGVGGGVILDGHIVTGAFGAGGEIGHMPVSPAQPYFRQLLEKNPKLRSTADLEYFASATGIARIANAALQTFEEDSELRSHTGWEPLEARHVFDAAKNGDGIAIAVTDFFFDILGQGLATIASVVDPELFIIGGGVAAAGDYLLEGLRESYRRQVFHASRDTALRLASLGNDAGLLGPLVPILL